MVPAPTALRMSADPARYRGGSASSYSSSVVRTLRRRMTPSSRGRPASRRLRLTRGRRKREDVERMAQPRIDGHARAWHPEALHDGARPVVLGVHEREELVDAQLCEGGLEGQASAL